ncbi:hypothetical protein BX661DRAFT_185232 [Kickxella alabastrina]|uniref:uncharacterized protein n=1 Tax=Kickxella alabastrina TaxID=61397 RepID=UPI002220B311|nr:uncharacterized protein BX661DRAFT_185232 [Kickxella alabastrina]KAI7825084.1 hypothetical protein BX661DRAFT_185232 [Kickxella alabastrina]
MSVFRILVASFYSFSVVDLNTPKPDKVWINMLTSLIHDLSWLIFIWFLKFSAVAVQ